MALSIRDKLFITLRWPIHGTRYTRSTGQTASGCGLPVGAARVAERASERASERTSEQRRERKRERESQPRRRLSKPIFGISFGKHNVLRTLFMGSIRNLSAGDPALHPHTTTRKKAPPWRCCSRYANRRVRCHLRGPRLIGYAVLIHRISA